MTFLDGSLKLDDCLIVEQIEMFTDARNTTGINPVHINLKKRNTLTINNNINKKSFEDIK